MVCLEAKPETGGLAGKQGSSAGPAERATVTHRHWTQTHASLGITAAEMQVRLESYTLQRCRSLPSQNSRHVGCGPQQPSCLDACDTKLSIALLARPRQAWAVHVLQLPHLSAKLLQICIPKDPRRV